MKKFTIVLTLMMFLFIFIGCDSTESSDYQMNQQQEKLAKEAVAELGLPAIKNFTEKRFLKMILELRDQPNIINYAYLFAENSGQLIFIGKCVGYGIPYATQFTNPSKIAQSHQSGYGVLPQADPNGLFSPASAEGTWLMLVNPQTNKPQVVYIEPRILVSPFPLR